MVSYTVDILLQVDRSCEKSGIIRVPSDESEGEIKVVTLLFNNIVQISSVRIYVPQDLKSYDSRQSVKKSIKAVIQQFKDKIPLLDPIEDMKIKDKDFKALVAKIESDEKRLLKCENISTDSVKLFIQKEAVNEKIKKVKAELRKAQSLLQMDELKCRKRVLRRLGYCTASDVIEIKGRVACEITRYVLWSLNQTMHSKFLNTFCF